MVESYVFRANRNLEGLYLKNVLNLKKDLNDLEIPIRIKSLLLWDFLEGEKRMLLISRWIP